MPMRVEIARPSSFMTRRSMVRATRLVTIRKPAITTMPLSSDQRLNLRLAGNQVDVVERAFEPAEPAEHLEGDRCPEHEGELSSQARNQLFGPSETEMACTAKRTSTSTVARSIAMSMSSTRIAKLANSARSPRTSTRPVKDGRQHHAGDDQALRPARAGRRARPAAAASA